MAAVVNFQNAEATLQPTVQIVGLYPQYVPITGQQIQYQSSGKYPRQKSKKIVLGLSIAECVTGALSIILAVSSASIAGGEVSYYIGKWPNGYHTYSDYGWNIAFNYSLQGAWCGIFVIVTGILRIRLVNKPSKCVYIANMAMAMLAVCIAFAAILLFVNVAAVSHFSQSLVRLHFVIAILCAISLLLEIIHSILICGGARYGLNFQNTHRPDLIQTPGSTQAQYIPQSVRPQPQFANGQLIIVANPQALMQEMQPIVLPQSSPLTDDARDSVTIEPCHGEHELQNADTLDQEKPQDSSRLLLD